MINEHALCHDIKCNAHTKHPRGARNVGCSCPDLEYQQNIEHAGLQAEIERLQAVLRRMRIEFTDIRTSRALENIGTLVCNCGAFADAVATMIDAALGGEAE